MVSSYMYVCFLIRDAAYHLFLVDKHQSTLFNIGRGKKQTFIDSSFCILSEDLNRLIRLGIKASCLQVFNYH